jgi:anthrone oxygenase-like protein
MAVFIDHGSGDDDERGRRAPHGIASQDALRAQLYVRLHRTLYPTFGKTAGPAEAVAVASTAALAWTARRQDRRSSRLTVAAAGCLAAAHGVFWSVVQPANVEMMRWPLDAIPQDWANWRNRWEYGHAVRAGLVTTALAALTWSILRDAADPVN